MELLKKHLVLKFFHNANVRLQILNANPASTGQLWDESGSYTIDQVLTQKIRYLQRISRCFEASRSEEESLAGGSDYSGTVTLSFERWGSGFEELFDMERYERYCKEQRILTRQLNNLNRLRDLTHHDFIEEFQFEVAKNKLVDGWERSRQALQLNENKDRCETLRKDTINREVTLQTAVQAGVLTDEFYSWQLEQVQQSIDEWMSRFDREKDELDGRLQKARVKKNHWNDLKTEVEQRTLEIQRLQGVETAHLERIKRRELCLKSATKIQAWWRGVIVRRGIVLGARKRKKKQSKKGKAKNPKVRIKFKNNT
ncbi:conserved hypothetical protein [Culex quinquefasciatus]|uniref:Dynein regulatory complex protein 9 n=1 Tax=Culex quinquefasciatus TaxID=7176 RepID=B0WKN3_CULQU|nr:conserved hypothetical protein [Culex quinquefasciatus]|eukprot:XP_001849267.1 conserved hypothetical protein [Culex quinquefasciatus]